MTLLAEHHTRPNVYQLNYSNYPWSDGPVLCLTRFYSGPVKGYVLNNKKEALATIAAHSLPEEFRRQVEQHFA